MATIALFFSRHFICQRAVQKLELSSDVNMFDKNAVNGVTKKLFTISKNYKIATKVKSLFTVHNNRVLTQIKPQWSKLFS